MARFWLSATFFNGCRLRRRFWMGILGAIATLALGIQAVPAEAISNYALAQAADFNQVESYPVELLPSSTNYRPVGEWNGRLILPSVEEYTASPGDWVWMEVWHSPIATPNLVGQRVKLSWRPDDARTAYVKTVTRDITFSEQAQKFDANGNIVPTRLDGRQSVGPLQSLAGARPNDDITVRLVNAQLAQRDPPELQIGLEPIQITGREYALVKILGPDPSVDKPRPPDCPGNPPCPSEYFQVQHYNSASGDFDGDLETIRIPQQPRLKGDRFFSSIRDLEISPAGAAGWYVYGARNSEGIFTVQALKPRSLFQLEPDDIFLGQHQGLSYIDRQNWHHTPERKGTAQRVLVSPTATTDRDALAAWEEGDYALVGHLFGGIGGENKELTPAGTVTGHFAYGLARVVQDPFTEELQFDIQYQQIYAHNSGGIISGTHDWSSYAGDLQRGWIGQRPFSDVVIKHDAFLEPLQLGETTLHLFRELLIQTQIIAARYRTGDGTGVAAVTPATSCVQDSSQALYIAIERIKQAALSDAGIKDWIAANPDSPEVKKLNQFIAIGTALRQMLTPYGTVRPDWQYNAEALAGVNNRDGLVTPSGLLNGILSWQNMMPRWGQDAVLRVFLEEDAQLWFLRPNQIGGDDAAIVPIPPTSLFGLVPGLGRATKRFTQAFAEPVPGWSWGISLLALAVYGAIALPYGLKSNFLKPQGANLSLPKLLWVLVRLFFLPALVEEIVFRVLLLPHPLEGITPWRWWLWGLLSLGLYVLYHWVNAKTLYRQAETTFCDRRFLISTALLGLTLTLVYRLTGSLWTVTLLHWIVVCVWLLGLGGYERLQGTQTDAPAKAAHP